MSDANSIRGSSVVPFRPVQFFSSTLEMRSIPGNAWIVQSIERLSNYDVRVGDWLDRWAAEAPERAFMVEQTATGERTISYAEARDAVLSLAEGLLSHELSAERPLIILAPNGIDPALLMLAALYLGIPVAPIAPAYALQSRDFDRLSRVITLLTPGMVAIADGDSYRAALLSTVTADVPVVALRNSAAGSGQLDIASLYGDGSRRLNVAKAAAAVGRETIAKFLFTSGSTGSSKAVINTHGMLCAASQMQRQVAAFLVNEPPVMVDWLPWNHTAGGNSIFSFVLHNGGTLYIDRGNPTPEHIGGTLELLRRISPTIYFNVPMGFDALLPHLERERELRETFFRRLKFLWYAGASMQPKTWRALEQLAIETIGQRILIVTGLGMTETSPIALFGNLKANGPGIVGVPVPGLELKLVAHEDKLEARYRGPNVTPGYWRDSGATAEAFDDEGFFASGDLLEFVDPKDPAAGLRFEGRLSDDFKLDSGTRVHASALRLTALEALRPLVSDVVIVGANRPDVRMLIFPDWEDCAREFGFDAAMAIEAMAMVTALRAAFKDRLAALRNSGTGSSNRIVAGLLVLTKPSAAAGELTEKGTINARVLQRNRPELLELLFGDGNTELIIS